MDSILPDSNASYDDVVANTAEEEEELPILQEYAWDFDRKDFAYKDGKFQVVEGLEAIKIWIYKALSTERYRYPAYSWDYGQELEELIGNNMDEDELKSECERLIEESLSVSPYVNGVTDLKVTRDGDKITIEAAIDTEYGEVKVSV